MIKNNKYIRIYDLIISITIFLVLCPIFLLLFILCFFDTRNPIFIQERVGKNKKPFNLFKFRTMRVNTPSLASHLVNENQVTPFGRYIRKLKLDELPQIINVIRGEMSLIGPRPCLFNQIELIAQREKYKIFLVQPGITGLGQLKGIDMSNPERLAETDSIMIKNFNQINYFKYLFLTFYGKGIRDSIKTRQS